MVHEFLSNIFNSAPLDQLAKMPDTPEEQRQASPIPAQLQSVLAENPLQADVCYRLDYIEVEDVANMLQDAARDDDSSYNDS